jgi:glycerate kinase
LTVHIVIAPDSFKESLSAKEGCEAVARGVLRACPEAQVDRVPMADGGEGTVDALVAATHGTQRTVTVTGPLGTPVEAVYGVLGDDSTAVIEMAAASGLEIVPPEQRDACITTTYGTGELICHALDAGATRLIIGIGGSATNDGGAGVAQALGYRLTDADNRELDYGGTALARLAHIDASNRHPRIGKCAIDVACDVTNPLCGPNGASAVYGPQKGATPDAVEELDTALEHYADIVEAKLNVTIRNLPGAGAAGGLGAGLVTFTGARLRSGVELVAEACGLADRVRGADLVITGEGRIDGQTAQGKTPVGVARVARAAGVPVIALAGMVVPGFETVYDEGIDAVFAIAPEPMPKNEALACAAENMERTAAAVMRLWIARGSR